MDENLLRHVREVARQLDAELCAAEAATRGWSDAARTVELSHAALSRCLDRLAATGCWGEANRLPSGELWRIAGRWLEAGWLQHHARFKPHGYAGDHEMLERICAGTLCAHPLGHAFDQFFQAQTAPQAVRNRTALIADAIVACVRKRPAAPIYIVSIGSGPALDVRRAGETLTPDERRRVRLSLLDLDPAALEHARSRLEPLYGGERLTCRRENLFRLAQPGRVTAELANVDLLACSGIFDYLDDAAVIAMLSRFWAALRPSGRALVFNFGLNNPSRAYMEWIGNWYLTYRSADAMQSLATRAGIPPSCFTVSAEATGVNLFWDVRR